MVGRNAKGRDVSRAPSVLPRSLRTFCASRGTCRRAGGHAGGHAGRGAECWSGSRSQGWLGRVLGGRVRAGTGRDGENRGDESNALHGILLVGMEIITNVAESHAFGPH